MEPIDVDEVSQNPDPSESTLTDPKGNDNGDVTIVDLVTPAIDNKTISNKENIEANNNVVALDEEDSNHSNISSLSTSSSASSSTSASSSSSGSQSTATESSPSPSKTEESKVTTDTESKDDTETAVDAEPEPEPSSEEVDPNYTTSRYGRKRKKVNYSLSNFWGSSFGAKQKPKEEEEYKVESEQGDDEDDQDEDFEDESSRKPKGKKAAKNKGKKTNTKTKKKGAKTGKKSKKEKSKSPVEKAEAAETFFMTTAEKRQHKKQKIMKQFTEDIERDREQNRRLNAGKKANPFFEINKQRQEAAKLMPKVKRSDTASSQLIPCPPFPTLSSIVPKSITTIKNLDDPMSDLSSLCDLFESDFDNDMDQIETQMAELLYSPAPLRTRRSVINLISPSNPPTAQRLKFNDSNPLIIKTKSQKLFKEPTTPRFTHYWHTQEALNNYLSSSEFTSVIAQCSRQFPEIAHSTLKTELSMCLNRSIHSTSSAMWCDKYKPTKATEVVGNWNVANEVKRWLVAWRNGEERKEYLRGGNQHWIEDDGVTECNFYADSDDDWTPTVSADIELLNTVIITGPTACGKTASVYAVAAELEYKVIEVNCIVIKTAKDLQDLIGEATQSHGVAKKGKAATQDSENRSPSIILLEEVDNMLESAPSIVRAITNFMEKSRSPIILTAQKVPEVLETLGLTEFQFGYGSMERLALRAYVIALAEGICMTRKEIELIVGYSDYDLRSVLINMQFWLTSPRTFDHYLGKDHLLPLPSSEEIQAAALTADRLSQEGDGNDEESIFPPMLYQLPETAKQIGAMHSKSVFQRVIGYADLSHSSCSGKDHLFWSHFVGGDLSGTYPAKEVGDHLYCMVQHALSNHFIDDIVYHTFPYWFIGDMQSVGIYPKSKSPSAKSSPPKSSLMQLFDGGGTVDKTNKSKGTGSISDCVRPRGNSNPFKYSWRESESVVKAKNVISSLIDSICGTDDISDAVQRDVEMKQVEKASPDRERMNVVKDMTDSEDIKWLQDWSTMINALSDNDIFQQPHGSCVNSTYHDRLHPHSRDIYDDPMSVTLERCRVDQYENPYYLDDAANTETKEQPKSNPFALTKQKTATTKPNPIEEDGDDGYRTIYDTVQHDYLREHISPYLVTSAIQMGSNNNTVTVKNFEPQLICDLHDRQMVNGLHQYNAAAAFRKRANEGNFDGPTTRAWFEYYHEFITTVCIKEYHREKAGGSSYRNGREIRRSRRKSTLFEHVLKGWIDKDECTKIAHQWKDSFEGMGWKTDTLPVL